MRLTLPRTDKKRSEYDLIFIDVQMPRMNGFEATAVIREKERSLGSHTPIVAMTAHALKEDEQRCLNAGMEFYVSECPRKAGPGS